MKMWRNLAFVLLVVAFWAAQQSGVQTIGTYYSVMNDHGCGTGGGEYDGFYEECDDWCDAGNSLEFEDYYADIWAACADYCMDSDYPTAGAGPGCQDFAGNVSIWDWDPHCLVECNCLCS